MNGLLWPGGDLALLREVTGRLRRDVLFGVTRHACERSHLACRCHRDDRVSAGSWRSHASLTPRSIGGGWAFRKFFSTSSVHLTRRTVCVTIITTNCAYLGKKYRLLSLAFPHVTGALVLKCPSRSATRLQIAYISKYLAIFCFDLCAFAARSTRVAATAGHLLDTRRRRVSLTRSFPRGPVLGGFQPVVGARPIGRRVLPAKPSFLLPRCKVQLP